MWQLSAGTTLETFVMSAMNDPTLFRIWHVVDPRFNEPLKFKKKIKKKNMKKMISVH